MDTPSLKPMRTGVFFALLSTTVKTDAAVFSIRTASTGSNNTSLCFSTPTFAMAYIPGRSSPLGFSTSILCQHCFGAFIERMREAGDRALVVSARQFVHADLHRQTFGN